MSEPRFATGTTKLDTCKRCRQRVVFSELAGMYGGKTHWTCEPHTAPCGQICWGGGARGRGGLAAFKAKQLHGFDDYPCPECGQ